ncbi:hypothetical protein E2C01_100905 [Portunus trituberculatus]|uniref:Uncharacterized protein n=1 Tax=Portunus trituberculatus TaxID=210409 RepID=A0A5B7KEI6_PORTR|nr:hypothetical protein [Portunus trituberculatus]
MCTSPILNPSLLNVTPIIYSPIVITISSSFLYPHHLIKPPFHLQPRSITISHLPLSLSLPRPSLPTFPFTAPPLTATMPQRRDERVIMRE